METAVQDEFQVFVAGGLDDLLDLLFPEPISPVSYADRFREISPGKRLITRKEGT